MTTEQAFKALEEISKTSVVTAETAWALDYAINALENQHESLTEKKKTCPTGTLSKKETIEYLLAIDDAFCIEPSVMRNAIYSAVGYLKRGNKDDTQT